MTQCLNRLSKRFEAPSADTTTAATEPVASILPQLPSELGRDEYTARFIFKERDLFKGGEVAGRPKPTAFKPECFEGNWELSVCRNTGLQQTRIWEIARTCREGMRAIARADVGMDIAEDQQLMGRMAVGAFPEHAVLVGWDPTGNKDAHMMQMVALANASHPSTPPA
jgi:hypothetical protein